MWLNLLGIDFVSDVNKIVATGRIQDLIKKNDISVDNNLYDIAREIRDKKKKLSLFPDRVVVVKRRLLKS